MPNRHAGFPIRTAVAALAACAALFPASPRAEGLTLEQAIREALANSEEALLLKEKEKRFEALKQQAWSGAFPRISAYANVGRGASPFDLSAIGFSSSQQPDRFQKDAQGNLIVDPVANVVHVDTTPQPSGPVVVNVAQNRYSYGVQVDQSIFTFGRLGQAIKTAGIQEKADNSSRKRSLQELQLQVLDAYYNAATFKARLGTLEASVKRQSETVNFLESNFRMGSGKRANVMLAVTSLKSLEPQRIRAERDAESARRALNRVIGRPLESPLELDTATHIAMEPVKALPDSGQLDSLIATRADMQALQLQRKSLEGQAKYIKMQYLPSLGAQGKLGVLAFKGDQLFEYDANREWSVGVGLNWTLFDGLGLSSQAKQIQSDARSIGLNERQAHKRAIIDLEGAFLDYKAADTALVASEQAVVAAREAQALLSEDFRAGKGLFTDLLTAEENLRNAEFGVLNARYQQIRSAAALRVAMGKGLINEEAP
jgi:outer membrane protein TolC